MWRWGSPCGICLEVSREKDMGAYLEGVRADRTEPARSLAVRVTFPLTDRN